MKIGLDFDGTIVDCRPRQEAALVAAAAACGRDAPLDLDGVWQRRRHGATLVEALVAGGIDAAEARRIGACWVETVEDDAVLPHDPLLPDARAVLTRLAACHDLAIVSARRRPDGIARQIADLGLADLVGELHVVPPGAGAAAAKAEILRRRKIACFVGDTESDLGAARFAEIPVCLVATGQRDGAWLARAGDGADVPVLGTLADFENWMRDALLR